MAPSAGPTTGPVVEKVPESLAQVIQKPCSPQPTAVQAARVSSQAACIWNWTVALATMRRNDPNRMGTPPTHWATPPSARGLAPGLTASSSWLVIMRTALLSFISGHHYKGKGRIPGLKEVPVKGASMRRRSIVTYRANAFLSPATRRMLDLLVQSSAAP